MAHALFHLVQFLSIIAADFEFCITTSSPKSTTLAKIKHETLDDEELQELIKNIGRTNGATH
jgi:arsenate reductase-like glutaredoxin family protein